MPPGLMAGEKAVGGSALKKEVLTVVEWSIFAWFFNSSLYLETCYLPSCGHGHLCLYPIKELWAGELGTLLPTGECSVG